MPRESLTENLQALRIDHDRRGGGSTVPSWLKGILALIAAIVLIFAAWWGLAGTLGSTTVSVARVVSMEVREPSTVLVAGGYVVAHHKIQLSSKVMGKVAWIGVEKGDTVQADQVLVRLEDFEYKAQFNQASGNLAAAEAQLRKLEAGSRPQEIEQSRAQADQARANLLNIKVQYDRAVGLRKEGVISQGDLDTAKANYEMAKGQSEAADKVAELVRIGPRREEIDNARGVVGQARGAVEFAKTQVDSTEIRSPIRGTVLERLVERGEMVTTSFVGDRGAKSSVVALADLNDLQVELDINQNDFARISPKQQATITADAYPDHRYHGIVDEIAPEGNRQKATVQVKVKVTDPDGKLRPEMNAKVSFLAVGGGEVKGTELIIPKAAVFQSDGKSAVMTVEDSRAVLKQVTLGDSSGDNVRVQSGLTANDSVILSNPNALKNGQRIRVK